jgi:hypothetical protein
MIGHGRLDRLQSIDECESADNAVRVVGAFIEELNLVRLGFDWAA